MPSREAGAPVGASRFVIAKVGDAMRYEQVEVYMVGLFMPIRTVGVN